MLGHEVTFNYCRAPGAELPCRKIADCWWEAFDIANFLRQHYSRQQIRQITQPPKAKILTLVELIDKARHNAQTTNKDNPSGG